MRNDSPNQDLLRSFAALFMVRPSWPLAGIASLVLAMSLGLFKEQTNRLVIFITHRIAKYSYGIYLGHTLCIWAAFWALRHYPWYVQGTAFLVLVFVIPVALFVLIEQRGIDLGKRVARQVTAMRRAAGA